MRINQNIAAFNAYRNLNNTQNNLSSTLEKLSSGFRINRAADDASGLVNSENLRAQIGGLKVATRNAQDSISMVQTAEGAQTEVHSILQRMRDLVVEAGNVGTNDAEALKANQDEINQLQSELDRINRETQFGTRKIFTEFNAEGASSAGSGATQYQALAPVNITIAMSQVDTDAASVFFNANGQLYKANFSGLDGTSTTGDVVTQLQAAVAVTASGTTIGDGPALADAGAWSSSEAGQLTWTEVEDADVQGSLSITAANAFAFGIYEQSTTGAQSAAVTVTAEYAADLDNFTAGTEIAFQVDGDTYTVELAADITTLSDSSLIDALNAATAGGTALSTVGAWTLNGEDQLVFTSEAAASGGTRTVTFNDGPSAVALGFASNLNFEAEPVGGGDDEAAGATPGQATFQVGANATQTVGININQVNAETLGVDGVNVLDGEIDGKSVADRVSEALTAIDGAISTVSENRAELGAFQNRMESTIRNLSVAVENLSAAESRIRDTDMALEMVEFTRNQILSQAGTAMLAQANVIPQSVLSLLG